MTIDLGVRQLKVARRKGMGGTARCALVGARCVRRTLAGADAASDTTLRPPRRGRIPDSQLLFPLAREAIPADSLGSGARAARRRERPVHTTASTVRSATLLAQRPASSCRRLPSHARLPPPPSPCRARARSCKPSSLTTRPPRSRRSARAAADRRMYTGNARAAPETCSSPKCSGVAMSDRLDYTAECSFAARA